MWLSTFLLFSSFNFIFTKPNWRKTLRNSSMALPLHLRNLVASKGNIQKLCCRISKSLILSLNPGGINTQKPCTYNFSTISIDPVGSTKIRLALPEDGGVAHEEFLNWKNGGGIFHRSASIDPTAYIEVGAVVHSMAVLAANVHLGSGAVVGPGVQIGQSTKVGYSVALSNCTLGDSCIIHHGVCVGQDGFGFSVDELGRMSKKPQTMNAIIGNHVEIGANTCIDRGSWRDTVIGDHTKIDNLVQVGHNVQIGKNCILCGQVGIAGSATIGNYVTFGGRVAVRDHVSIVSKVRLAANSCVTKDIAEPGDYGGFPAVPISEWRRQVAARRKK